MLQKCIMVCTSLCLSSISPSSAPVLIDPCTCHPCWLMCFHSICATGLPMSCMFCDDKHKIPVPFPVIQKDWPTIKTDCLWLIMFMSVHFFLRIKIYVGKLWEGIGDANGIGVLFTEFNAVPPSHAPTWSSIVLFDCQSSLHIAPPLRFHS